jgi:hypothetical protein
MPLEDRIVGFLIGSVAGSCVVLGILPLARKHYRESRQQWLLARLVWIAFGGGVALLAGAMATIGIYGLLGGVGTLANVFLLIASVCIVMGILLIVLFTILGIADRVYRWSHPSNQDV